MPKTSLEVDSRLVRWAREAAGLSLEDTARKAVIPLSKLEEWETSEKAGPTPRQLEKLADVFKRPVALFFLLEPPARPAPLNDFRKLPQEHRRRLSPEALVAIRRARRFQAIYTEFREFAEEKTSPVRISTESLGRAEVAARAARRALPVGLEEQFAFQDDETAFRRWREAVEACGILVLQFERVEVEEVRGFSLLGDPPVIAINLHDRPVTAKIFTLFHELAHVLRGQDAICLPEITRVAGQDAVEIYCNSFAAEALVPEQTFLASPPVIRFRKRVVVDVRETVTEARKLFHVGRFVILRRLLTFGLISPSTYKSIASAWMKEQPPEPSGGGGEGAYQRKVLNELGRPLVRRVFRAQDIGAVSVGEVVGLLAVKRRHLETLRDLAFR